MPQKTPQSRCSILGSLPHFSHADAIRDLSPCANRPWTRIPLLLDATVGQSTLLGARVGRGLLIRCRRGARAFLTAVYARTPGQRKIGSWSDPPGIGAHRPTRRCPGLVHVVVAPIALHGVADV